MSEWPRNWADLIRGIGCEMCENGRPDANSLFDAKGYPTPALNVLGLQPAAPALAKTIAP